MVKLLKMVKREFLVELRSPTTPSSERDDDEIDCRTRMTAVEMNRVLFVAKIDFEEGKAQKLDSSLLRHCRAEERGVRPRQCL